MIKQENIRNFSIIAHIDHGKSTLSDRLIEKCGAVEERIMEDQILDNMDLERERGITIKARAVGLNYAAADGESYTLNLIDTPGHVDFNYEVSRSLAACEGAVLVVDASQGVEAQTLSNTYLALDNNLEILPVINKIDLPAADPKRVKEEIEEIIGLPAMDAPEISAKAGINIDAVLEDIVKNVPAPSGDPDAPLKALIFDSQYDNYRGVIVLMRLIDGRSTAASAATARSGSWAPARATRSWRSGTCARSASSPATSFPRATWATSPPASRTCPTPRWATPSPTRSTPPPRPCPATGPRGPWSSAASTPRTARSTPTCATRSTSSSSTTPPSPTSRRARWRSASASAAVFWACCTWRSSRSGSSASLTSSSSRPCPRSSTRSSRPTAAPSWSTTPTTIRTWPRSPRPTSPMSRSRSSYEMPLNEIIYDFFDTLKARTKGYASLDYELSEYKLSDLVKVDMLLNGDQVDALSFIAHREKAYPRARKLCEKLKENIPRQLFEVPIQAAIGGKIIARETVKAMRKDVLAKCYGGDITRKKKLLEKQKEGKKKMRQLGTVSIPTEAFLAVLKLDE